MSTQVQRLPVLENEAISQLSPMAEIFFHRLLNAVDRYGCFDARPGMLRGRLYALTLDKVSNDNMAEWLAECVAAGLVKCYQANGLPYLQVAGFKRSIGPKKTPWPAPPFEDETGKKTTAKPMPGKEHEFFFYELYKRENESALARLEVLVRQPIIKQQWIHAFNDYLQQEQKRYVIDYEWYGQLKIWLPKNIQQLLKQDAVVKTQMPEAVAA